MKEQIFTFWEGKMPDYIQMCLNTWKYDYVLLNYDNLSQYTDLKVDEKLKRFTLPQIADAVRVHVLRDNGGYWFDADTIMITDELPTENIAGYPNLRTNTIGYLHTEPHSDMFEKWARYQDGVITEVNYIKNNSWDLLGNLFTDPYVKAHQEISICDVSNKWAETYMIRDGLRWDKYKQFYFKYPFHLKDLKPTNMLMLHNSWTPDYYKHFTESEVLAYNCTLSNILKEILL